MRVIQDVRTLAEPFPNTVLTIGSFDGLHLGHRRIIDEVIRAARSMNGAAAVMTLRPHPREFFSPRNAPNILLCDAKKEALLAEMGVDALFILPFNAEVARMSPGAFLDQILMGRCAARKLVVGHDFAFGKDAAGDFEFLQRAAPDYGFDVVQVPQLVIQGERVSSSLIREMILQGEVDTVETFLGRKYSLVGEVVSGRGIGAKLGFATANLEPAHSAIPAHGIYVAEAFFAGERRMAAVNVGVAPTIRNEEVTVEAHLLDFDRNIVGETMELVFQKRLRGEKRFDSLDDLIAAIGRDVQAVRDWFGRELS
jgi:riboflavin kinase/FMN adenylyltransferase